MKRFLFSTKILPIIIILLGGVCGYYIYESGDQKPKRNFDKKVKRLRTVQVSELTKGSVVPTWDASGFVIAAETVNVSPRVAGNIESLNPSANPGGVVKKGEWLATLETIEYELAVRSQKSLIDQAEANYQLEMVDQKLAVEELKLLGDNGLGIEQSLVLREPQLTVAKAKVAVARNNLEKAQLNLQRTKVVMPFDGKILAKNVGVGSKVSTNTTLFSVVNTEVYWLEVKVPHTFNHILDTGESAMIYHPRMWGEGVNRQAQFVSILPALDQKDRQIKVLLAITDPLALESDEPAVFINDFLNVQLKGQPIENSWTIRHSWLQPDNTIWVVDKANTLQKRPVDVLFKGRELIYVDIALQKGDRALAEKPGIASVGLKVKVRRQQQVANMEQSGKQMNVEKAPKDRDIKGKGHKKDKKNKNKSQVQKD